MHLDTETCSPRHGTLFYIIIIIVIFAPNFADGLHFSAFHYNSVISNLLFSKKLFKKWCPYWGVRSTLMSLLGRTKYLNILIGA